MAFLDENGVSRLWTRVLSKLGSKVDKVDGKGLSTNDYTTEEKNKLAGVENGAQANQNAIGTITANGDTVFTSGAVSDTFKLSSGSNILYAKETDGSLTIGVDEGPIFHYMLITGDDSTLPIIEFGDFNSNKIGAINYFLDGSFGIMTKNKDTDLFTELIVNLDSDPNTALELNYTGSDGFAHVASIYNSDMTLTIPISQGGTGSSTASGALASLGAAAANHTHALSDGTITGSLPIENGGTGATTATQALLNLGGVSSYEPEFTSRITLTADSMPTIFMKASGGNTKQILIEGNTNNGLTFGISSDDTHTNRRYLGIYDPIIAPSLADALQLTSVDNGVSTAYNIFHSGAGGTFGGVAKADAASVSALGTAQLRNITISTTDLVEGESTLADGEVYLVYKE